MRQQGATSPPTVVSAGVKRTCRRLILSGFGERATILRVDSREGGKGRIGCAWVNHLEPPRGCRRKACKSLDFGEWCNGSTTDSGTKRTLKTLGFPGFFHFGLHPLPLSAPPIGCSPGVEKPLANSLNRGLPWPVLPSLLSAAFSRSALIRHHDSNDRLAVVARAAQGLEAHVLRF